MRGEIVEADLQELDHDLPRLSVLRRQRLDGVAGDAHAGDDRGDLGMADCPARGLERLPSSEQRRRQAAADPAAIDPLLEKDTADAGNAGLAIVTEGLSGPPLRRRERGNRRERIASCAL